MKQVICLVLLLLCPITSLLSAQSVIKGQVVDETGGPVGYATVYINGTSKGARTDMTGTFEIEHVTIPCQLVVSHLGYVTTMKWISDWPEKPISISVQERVIQLSEVSVIGKSQKEALIKQFKEMFLGIDTWGKAARLLNDSVLVFGLEYGKDSIQIKQKYRALSVTAKEPLKLDLPLLGYELSIDLALFSLVQTQTALIQLGDSTKKTFARGKSICTYLGYYYVSPYKDVKASKIKKYERNRRDVFYNSKEHFCRALYHNNLKKNGFLLMEYVIDSVSRRHELIRADIDTSFRYSGNGQMKVIGLKDREFSIHYFCKFNGEPIDLTKKNLANDLEYFNAYSVYYRNDNRSNILFLSDTCTISKNGLIPDLNIAFIGKNNAKKAGATLPEGYLPLQ